MNNDELEQKPKEDKHINLNQFYSSHQYDEIEDNIEDIANQLNHISSAIIPIDQVGRYTDYTNFEPATVTPVVADEDEDEDVDLLCQVDTDICTNGHFKGDKIKLFKSKKQLADDYEYKQTLINHMSAR